MVSRLVLVLGDQLTHGVAALTEADRDQDVVMMAEVMGEATYVPHHPKKIAFLFAAMRQFCTELRSEGWRVLYTRLDDPDNTGTLVGEILRRAAETGAVEVLATEPGEWRVISALEDCPVPVHMFPDTRFLCSHAEFEAWAEGRKELRMEWFYREMRRKTGLLMDGDKPATGKWNYDHDNRKPARAETCFAGPLQFEPGAEVSAVLDLVAAQFGENFGELRPFWFATTRRQARLALDHFVDNDLEKFGDFQDAMLLETSFLAHSVLSMYLNAGLLVWQDVCDAVVDAWRAGRVPINAAEGYVRQVIGWREFMRGIYFREGPNYARRNVLEHRRDLPGFYWTGETRMTCIRAAVIQTRDEAYAHHIQRLMVTGNFALLAGVDPYQVHEWYLAVYADAFEWVEAPNVIGMSQFADGGIVGSKPYISGGAYIHRMSNYCKSCQYEIAEKSGAHACPFNYLYWAFLHRHRDRFGKNPRMAQMYRTWMRMSQDKRDATLSSADAFLSKLESGAPV
ncbi:MAG: cryptochrome/photolyase family protein [Pseudomonadota bacterium]